MFKIGSITPICVMVTALLSITNLKVNSQPINRWYIDESNRLTKDSTQFKYYIDVFKDSTDNAKFEVSRFSRQDKLTMNGIFSDSLGQNRSGRYTEYYETGIKESEGNFEGYNAYGLHTDWYSNGEKRMERFESKAAEYHLNSRVISCWDSTGKKIATFGEGECVMIYHDPLAFSRGPVTGGYKSGMWKGYYPDGTLTFNEEYLQNKLIRGISTDSAGNKYLYNKVTDNDKFIEEFLSHLGRTIIYPEKARRRGIQGKVFISFIIEPDGSHSNHQVERSLEDSCDAEALRVVRTYNKKWDFGKIRGLNYNPGTKVRKVIPVFFILGG